jgi:hypothetical protein
MGGSNDNYHHISANKSKTKRFQARSLSYAGRSQMFDVIGNLPSTSK